MRTRFCEEEATKAVEFFPKHLSFVEAGKAGRPFVLEKFQAEDIRYVFGTQRYDSEIRTWIRLVRTVYEEIPRKNGKSTKGAGTALKLTYADNEPGAQVFSVAEDLEQANRIFSIAARMVEASPTLMARTKFVGRRLIETKSGNVYRVIPGDASGNLHHNPHGVIFDELRTQATRELWDVMTTGQGTRTQPLTWAYTTAGTGDGIWWEQHEYGERLKAGLIEDPTFHYIRYGIEDGDDWSDEEVWKRCNPATGAKFLRLSFLRDEFRVASNAPARENAFRNLYLNEKTGQVSRWISLPVWDHGGGERNMVAEDDLEGEVCYAGLHATSAHDLAALCYDFPDAGEHRILWRFFLPRDQLAELNRRTAGQAAVWVREGRLTLTDPPATDMNRIREQIEADADTFSLAEVQVHRFNWQAIQDIEQASITAIRAPQGAQLAEATKELEKLVLAGKYLHGGNPVARWMVDNATVKRDTDGNIRLDFEHSGDNVCGIFAAVFALDRAMLAQDTAPGIRWLGMDEVEEPADGAS